jgi:hypothetical protein
MALFDLFDLLAGRQSPQQQLANMRHGRHIVQRPACLVGVLRRRPSSSQEASAQPKINCPAVVSMVNFPA